MCVRLGSKLICSYCRNIGRGRGGVKAPTNNFQYSFFARSEIFYKRCNAYSPPPLPVIQSSYAATHDLLTFGDYYTRLLPALRHSYQ